MARKFPITTALVAVFLCLLAPRAQAHGWYTRTGCCGGSDCAPVPIESGWVEPTDKGYHIVLTAEQAKLVNPAATLPVDLVIPWGNSRIKVAPKLEPGESYGPTPYHLCIPAGWSGVWCLFVVPNT